MSKEVFKEFFKHTLRWEGGGKLHNIKGDSGGWTIWGIAYNKNKHLFNSLEEFKKLSYEEAYHIAYNKYYLPIQTDKLPYNCQLLYFDMAYNMGNSRAIKIVQKCLGLKQDGVIGKITKSKLHLVDVECLYVQRNEWYKLLKNKTSWANKFYKGWMNRSKDIYEKSKNYEKQDTNSINNNTDSNSRGALDKEKYKGETTFSDPTKSKNSNIKDRLLNYIKKWNPKKISGRYPETEGDN